MLAQESYLKRSGFLKANFLQLFNELVKLYKLQD